MTFFLSYFPPFLYISDVDVPSPDEKSVITYVSSIYDAFPKIPEGGEGISAHVSVSYFSYLLMVYQSIYFIPPSVRPSLDQSIY